MPDERKPIRERLGKLDVEPRRQEEIERELGEHLADLASALEAQGMTREAAAKASVESVSDWRQLGRDILAAEMEETMNHRTRVLWLPAVGALFASYSLTAIIQVCAPLTHSPWLNPLITVRPGYFPWYVLLLPWVALQPLVERLVRLGRAGRVVPYGNSLSPPWLRPFRPLSGCSSL